MRSECEQFLVYSPFNQHVKQIKALAENPFVPSLMEAFLKSATDELDSLKVTKTLLA